MASRTGRQARGLPLEAFEKTIGLVKEVCKKGDLNPHQF